MEALEHRVELTPGEALPLMEECLIMQRPFILHGSPGSSKSAIMAQLCKKMDKYLIDMRLSLYEFIDLRGLPDTKGDFTIWKPPAELPKEGDPPSVLFLDEIGHADKSLQAASFQLVLDRKLGTYNVPDNCSIAAATNYITDNAQVEKMGSALKNRLLHIYIRTDMKDWGPWALVEGGIHELIVGYLRYQPSMLQIFDNAHNDQNKQFLRSSDALNTPRTWEWASDILNHFGVDKFDICFPLIAGLVGMPAATGLRGFIKYYDDLPDIDDLIKNPTKHKMPEKQQTIFALTTALSARLTSDNFVSIMKFMKKAEPEFQAAMIVDAIRRDPSLSDQPEFASWVVDNSKFIF